MLWNVYFSQLSGSKRTYYISPVFSSFQQKKYQDLTRLISPWLNPSCVLFKYLSRRRSTFVALINHISNIRSTFVALINHYGRAGGTTRHAPSWKKATFFLLFWRVSPPKKPDLARLRARSRNETTRHLASAIKSGKTSAKNRFKPAPLLAFRLEPANGRNMVENRKNMGEIWLKIVEERYSPERKRYKSGTVRNVT